MNRIVKNEINRLIGRYPTDTELKSAIDYIEMWVDDDTDTVVLRGLISDWVNDFMAECVNCGHWHLKDEMQPTGEGYFCDDDCIMTYDRNLLDLDAAHQEAYREIQMGY